MKKRIIALVLSLSMIFSPTVSAYAETDTNTTLTACEECGGTESHKEACSKYVEQIEKCEECGETESHKDTCSKYVEPVKKCEECGETEGHTEKCSQYVSSAQTCEKCGQEKCTCNKQSSDVETEVPVVNSAIKEEVTPAESAALEETDITANIYVENEGIYEEISEHSKDRPLDMKEYNGKTVYVLSSDAEQNIYFKSKSFTGIVGSLFWLNSKECATLTSGENVALGAQSATVTLKAAVPAETEVVLYAKKFMTEDYTVTIKVLDKLPEKEPDTEEPEPSTEVIVGENTFTSDVPMTVSATAEEKQEAVENAMELSDAEGYYFYDIHAEEAACITVEGLVNAEVVDSRMVNVLHLLDDVEAIRDAFDQGIGMSYFHVDDSSRFADEIAAGQEYSGTTENRVYYTCESAQLRENGDVTFETDSFSTFIFVVLFSFNGMEYSLSGGGSVHLSELMSTLAIEYSIDEVTDVVFTAPELLEVKREGEDWLLTSLDSFGTEEYLTITFVDGEEIKVKVTDPVIYNYAVGSDITKVSKLAVENVTIEQIINGDTTAQGRKYDVNTAQITMQNIIDAGTTDSKVTTAHMYIYAKEGMAIRFEAGTVWPTGANASRPTHGTNGVWFWSWDGTYNYAVIEEGAVGKQASFVVTTPNKDKPSYCNITLMVVAESRPQLLSAALPEINKELHSNYSIVNVPVTLYNYDGKAFNEHYNAQSGNYFAFSGTSKGVNSTKNAENRGWTASGVQANGGGGVALMGILKNKLLNGLPEMSQGQQVDLFSETSENGKTVYPDVGFQFIYNNDTGYYTYNSALNHAQYNSEDNEIQLYKQSLGPSDTPNGAAHGNAGFYPFEDINRAYTNTGYKDISWSTWAEKLEKNAFELIPSQYSADIVATGSTKPASTVDMHYGIQVNSDFYMPEGKTLNGQEMVYEFTGDDDLWVFIDGQLVLDIGGGHTHVSGKFNLTTGKVWIEKYTKLAAADGGSYETREQGNALEYTDDFLANLEDDKMHTIQIFYLERHGGVSNCRMRFNIPVVPTNSVTVEKELVNQNGDKLSVTPDVDYYFKLYTVSDDDDEVDQAADKFKALADMPYTIQGDGMNSYSTDSQGVFKLKAGQTALFSGIDRFTEVYAVEIDPYTESRSDDTGNQDNVYQYEQCVVETKVTDTVTKTYGKTDFNRNKEFASDTKVMQKNNSIAFKFTNYMQTQPLTIEKTVAGGKDGLINPEQKFTFNLDFTKKIVETGQGEIKTDNNNIPLTDGGSFELAHGESITIPRVPVNMTYTLSENNPDTANNSFDAPIFKLKIGDGVETSDTLAFVKDTVINTNKTSDFSKTIQDRGENKITVENLQHFDLKITKRILGETSTDQSFRFTVKGENSHNKATDLEVVIPASAFEADRDTSETDAVASAVIPNVPVGKYTVSEDTTWSWRYSLDDSSLKNVTVGPTEIGLPEHVVEFKNNRSNIYWLDGNSWCQNIFKETNIVKTQTTDNPERPIVNN